MIQQKKTPAQRVRKYLRIILMTVVSVGLLTASSLAAPSDVVQSLIGKTDSQPLRIILGLTMIALVPTILVMMTGFTRIVIVLSMTRNALGLQNTPPNIVIIGLSLILTFFVMSPVLTKVSDTAVEPYIKQEITYKEFGTKAMKPMRKFMLNETYKSDLNYFCKLAGVSADKSDAAKSGSAASSKTESSKSSKSEAIKVSQIPNRVVMAAFVTSELKHAFAIGLFIYIPFIIIDMIVASTLMAMGMMMLPPATISMPFKIMLFVLVDGWQLTIGTLMKSF